MNPHVLHGKSSNFYRKYVNTAKKKKTFLFKDFFSKCDQICSKLRIWSYLFKKSFIENSIFCAV